MKRMYTPMTVIAVGLGITPLSAQLDGKWEGAIQIQGVELTITVEFTTTDDTLGATIDIPQQGATGLALENVNHQHPSISFELPTPIGVAVFEGTHSGDEITGDFHQAGQAATFYLNRAAEEEPVADLLPYVEEEVEFTNGDVRLAGTLTVPPGDGPFPAVVTLTGSGPQNRDEELFGFKPFRVIADYLTQRGIAVLRYDDRGVGGSTGNIADATSVDFADDALSAITFLQGDARIRTDAIGLLGHSEGGIVGPLAASRSDQVAFVVMLAGPSLTGAEILELQGALILEAAGADETALEDQLNLQRTFFRALRTDTGWDDVDSAVAGQIRTAVGSMQEEQRARLGDIDAYVRRQVDQQIAQIRTPWFRHFIDHDPRDALRQVRVPILAVFGDLDLQVPAEQNAAELESVLRTAGHSDFTIESYPTANHLFIPAVTGSPSEYPTLEKVFVPGLLDMISGWIHQRTGSRTN